MNKDEAKQIKPLIEKELSEKKQKQNELNAEIVESQEKLSIINRDIEHYEGVLASIIALLEPDQAKRQADSIEKSRDLNDLNKTEAVREILRRGGNKGFTPKEIIHALQKEGIKISDSYVYIALNRETKQGTVKKFGKKYALA